MYFNHFLVILGIYRMKTLSFTNSFPNSLVWSYLWSCSWSRKESHRKVMGFLSVFKVCCLQKWSHNPGVMSLSPFFSCQTAPLTQQIMLVSTQFIALRQLDFSCNTQKTINSLSAEEALSGGHSCKIYSMNLLQSTGSATWELRLLY